MATAGLKRRACDLDSDSSEVVEDMDVFDLQPSKKARIHGVVKSLSPIKVSRKNQSCKYFDLHLSDGKREVRAVAFEPKIR